MMKPKIAFYWCAACGGCEEAVVDLAEDILDVVGAKIAQPHALAAQLRIGHHDLQPPTQLEDWRI